MNERRTPAPVQRLTDLKDLRYFLSLEISGREEDRGRDSVISAHIETIDRWISEVAVSEIAPSPEAMKLAEGWAKRWDDGELPTPKAAQFLAKEFLKLAAAIDAAKEKA